MKRITASRPASIRRIGRRYSLAGAAAFALSAALTGVAIAGSPYTVKLVVPASVVKSQPFTVTASGRSSNLSHLTVFLTNGACAPTAHKAKVLGGHKIIGVNVVHSYTHSHTQTANFVGTHAACAYLTSVSPTAGITYAHTKAVYSIH